MKDSKLAPFVVVGDCDAGLVQGIVSRFIDADFAAIGAATLREVSRLLADHYVNLLILNTEMGAHSGIEYVEQLRSNGSQMPTIFIADRNSQVSRVHALDVGDDIVQKPIPAKELVARARAVLRRSSATGDWRIVESITLNNEPFAFCGATVHPKDFCVTFPCGASVCVGRKEIGLMVTFAINRGCIVARKDVIHRVWGPHADIRSRSLDQYMVRIRHIFRSNGCSAIGALRTIHGVGYLYVKSQSGGNSCAKSNGCDCANGRQTSLVARKVSRHRTEVQRA